MADDYKIVCIHATGTSIVLEKNYTNGNSSIFTVAVLPSSDKAEKKEIHALTDDKEIKTWYGKNPTPSKVLSEAVKWGVDRENISKLTVLLGTLRTKSTTEKETVEGKLNIGIAGVKTKYEKETKEE